MKILIEQAKKFGIEINPDNKVFLLLLHLLVSKENADYFTNLSVSDVEHFTPEMAEKVKKLWADEGIQKSYERRNEYQIMDSAS